MSDFIDPSLPRGFGSGVEPPPEIIGPLPPNTKSPDPGGSPRVPKNGPPEDSSAAYGPQLPPELQSHGGGRAGAVYGPALPHAPEEVESSAPSLIHEDEEEFIGPMPVAAGVGEKTELEKTKDQLEARARKMKDKLTNKDSESQPTPRREEWMTELPPEIKPSGIGPRKFRTTTFDPGDRSLWTDTPADRERKTREGQLAPSKTKEKKPVTSRDVAMSEMVDEYNKKFRSESLMEMHRKRRAAEESSSKGERKPFDRETDLDLPHKLITPAKRQALMKDSSKSLQSKFTHGQRTYL